MKFNTLDPQIWTGAYKRDTPRKYVYLHTSPCFLCFRARLLIPFGGFAEAAPPQFFQVTRGSKANLRRENFSTSTYCCMAVKGISATAEKAVRPVHVYVRRNYRLALRLPPGSAPRRGKRGCPNESSKIMCRSYRDVMRCCPHKQLVVVMIRSERGHSSRVARVL